MAWICSSGNIVPGKTWWKQWKENSSHSVLVFFFFFAAQWTWDMSLDQSHGTMSTLGCIRQPQFSRGESHIPFSRRQRLSGLLCVPSTVVDPDSTYCGVICGSVHPIIVCVCVRLCSISPRSTNYCLSIHPGVIVPWESQWTWSSRSDRYAPGEEAEKIQLILNIISAAPV